MTGGGGLVAAAPGTTLTLLVGSKPVPDMTI